MVRPVVHGGGAVCRGVIHWRRRVVLAVLGVLLVQVMCAALSGGGIDLRVTLVQVI
ncbi:hypothetical protein [Sphingomonas sp.]|uniref:hypothetical protein n=1 Tax=Sphingomonas sp. TaxID=28214 RepID=UPI002617BD55|nr:hypothetical protein [Sphingomonas sp.]